MTTEQNDPMDERLERLEALAAMAAGELDDAERAALEQELAADPALAADLDRIRAADELLGSLPDEPVPNGVHDRLMAALEPVLDEQVTAPGGPTVRDRLLGWLPGGPLVPRLAAAAAALIVIAGVGVGLSQLGEGSGETAALSETAEPGDALAEDLAAGPLQPMVEGPTGGAYTEAKALELLSAYATEAWALDGNAAGQGGAPDDAYTGEAAQDRTGAEDAPGAPAEEDEAFADIERCLSKPFESEQGETLHAEVATYNDEPAIVYVIQRGDGAIELWVVDRAECGVLLFREAEATAEDE